MTEIKHMRKDFNDYLIQNNQRLQRLDETLSGEDGLMSRIKMAETKLVWIMTLASLVGGALVSIVTAVAIYYATEGHI